MVFARLARISVPTSSIATQSMVAPSGHGVPPMLNAKVTPPLLSRLPRNGAPMNVANSAGLRLMPKKAPFGAEADAALTTPADVADETSADR